MQTLVSLTETSYKMLHAALLLLCDASGRLQRGPRFTISLKRSTQIFSYPPAAGEYPSLCGRPTIVRSGMPQEREPTDDRKHTRPGANPAGVGSTMKLVKPPLRSPMAAIASSLIIGKMRRSSVRRRGSPLPHRGDVLAFPGGEPDRALQADPIGHQPEGIQREHLHHRPTVAARPPRRKGNNGRMKIPGPRNGHLTVRAR